MKLTFEINGYSITIDETEEGIVVAATKDDEVVEEFTLELGDESGEDFDEEGQEFPEDGQQLPEDGQAQGQAQAQDFVPEESEGKLESFTSFIRKRG